MEKYYIRFLGRGNKNVIKWKKKEISTWNMIILWECINDKTDSAKLRINSQLWFFIKHKK